MKIEAPQIQAAYSMGRSVYEGSVAKEVGAKQLAAENGMNVGSARDYIKAFRCLMDEQLFTRTINAEAADYYFANIHAEYGVDRLAKALRSMNAHIDYYKTVSKANVKKLKSVVAKYEAQIGNLSYELLQAKFAAEVSSALKDNPSARAARLQGAQKLPQSILVTTQYFVRNRDVAAEVLLRAKGTCELCQSPAPFLRKTDQTPYLEVHHKKQLAHNGEDTVENAIALCPNCHRKSHFGAKDA